MMRPAIRRCIALFWLAIAVSLLPTLIRADIFQWEYIDPTDPSQGRRQSSILCPGGAGVDAGPSADFFDLDLTKAYLVGADLTRASIQFTTLADADLGGADLSHVYFWAGSVNGAVFDGAEIRGTWFDDTQFSATQLYSTASYQARDLNGLTLWGQHLDGWNFAGQDLTNVSIEWSTLHNADFRQAKLTDAFFSLSSLTNANFTGADVRETYFDAGTSLSADQLYSTASYQARDLTGIKLTDQNLAGWSFAGQKLTNAYIDSFPMTTTDFTSADTRGAIFGFEPELAANMIWPTGIIQGLQLTEMRSLVVRNYAGDPERFGGPIPPIPILVEQQLTIDSTGVLHMEFDADHWHSIISFAPAIPVTLGGTLELDFAADVNLAGQMGRTIRIFDWTGVAPFGQFHLSSPHSWELSRLYTTGEITLIPEPNAWAHIALGVAGFVGFARWRTRSRDQRSWLYGGR